MILRAGLRAAARGRDREVDVALVRGQLGELPAEREGVGVVDAGVAAPRGGSRCSTSASALAPWR